MVFGIHVDADPDPASSAHAKNPLAAKPTIPPGHAGHVAGYHDFYSPYIYPNGRVDRPDCITPCLFSIFGGYGLLLSAVGYIGQTVVPAAVS